MTSVTAKGIYLPVVNVSNQPFNFHTGDRITEAVLVSEEEDGEGDGHVVSKVLHLNQFQRGSRCLSQPRLDPCRYEYLLKAPGVTRRTVSPSFQHNERRKVRCLSFVYGEAGTVYG